MTVYIQYIKSKHKMRKMKKENINVHENTKHNYVNGVNFLQ